MQCLPEIYQPSVERAVFASFLTHRQVCTNWEVQQIEKCNFASLHPAAMFIQRQKIAFANFACLHCCVSLHHGSLGAAPFSGNLLLGVGPIHMGSGAWGQLISRLLAALLVAPWWRRESGGPSVGLRRRLLVHWRTWWAGATSSQTRSVRSQKKKCFQRCIRVFQFRPILVHMLLDLTDFCLSWLASSLCLPPRNLSSRSFCPS